MESSLRTKAVKLNITQLEHLASLRIADALHEYDRKTRREWRWEPHLSGPLIRASVLFALEKRKLARWFPGRREGRHEEIPASFGGRMKITNAGKDFLHNAAGL